MQGSGEADGKGASLPRLNKDSPLAKISDAELVQKARAGDKESFAVLVHRYIRLVVAVAQASIGPQDAEDMAQDVFSEAWRSLEMLRSPELFKAWLVGITRHLCIYRLRRRTREEEIYTELYDLRRAQKPDDFEHSIKAEHRESIEQLKQAVEELPETYRRVILMRYMAGMSVEEIAQTLDITRAACDKRLTRAKQRLKDALKNLISGDFQNE